MSNIDRVLRWARSSSLWYCSLPGSCCGDEVFHAFGSRYDLERFGAVSQMDPGQADLLMVSGVVTMKAAPHLRALYKSMLEPRYVISVGSCANSGGAFGPNFSYSVLPGVHTIIPVDVYVPGCPPRPEAIMNGLIALQEKIFGYQARYQT